MTSSLIRCRRIRFRAWRVIWIDLIARLHGNPQRWRWRAPVASHIRTRARSGARDGIPVIFPRLNLAAGAEPSSSHRRLSAAARPRRIRREVPANGGREEKRRQADEAGWFKASCRGRRNHLRGRRADSILMPANLVVIGTFPRPLLIILALIALPLAHAEEPGPDWLLSFQEGLRLIQEERQRKRSDTSSARSKSIPMRRSSIRQSAAPPGCVGAALGLLRCNRLGAGTGVAPQDLPAGAPEIAVSLCYSIGSPNPSEPEPLFGSGSAGLGLP